MSDHGFSVDPSQKNTVNLVYILYLCSLFIGITSIIGVVLAYINKGNASPLLRSHYQNQIGIFWKMLLYTIIGAVLTIILIGLLIILAAIVWFVIRNIKGMQALSEGRPIDDPGNWGI